MSTVAAWLTERGETTLKYFFDEGDHKAMGDGGMMTKAPQIPVSCWNFYFNVDSIKAAVERVESGGGEVAWCGREQHLL